MFYLDMKNKFFTYIQTQDTIVAGLEAVDGQAKFKEDSMGNEGGGGRTRVIENGTFFEKAGKHLSCSRKIASNAKCYGEADFFACGLSLVLHPKSPMVLHGELAHEKRTKLSIDNFLNT
jgi:coproporphyrinogen III oxidase